MNLNFLQYADKIWRPISLNSMIDVEKQTVLKHYFEGNSSHKMTQQQQQQHF